MSDPSLQLQGALLSLLSGHIGAAVGPRVYDDPPDDPTFPYVTLGDCQVLPAKADCIDGVEAYPVVDVWTRSKGYPASKTIVPAILSVLDDQPDSFVLADFTVTVFEVQSVHYLRDPDGITRHASITFHALIEPK